MTTGDVLFRATQPVHSLHVVREGSVALIRTDARGEEITLYKAIAGECVAEPSLFAERYHCDARAVSPTSVTVYPRQAVLESLRSNPDMALQAAMSMAHLVQSTRTRVALLSLNKARDRILHYLQLARRNGADHVDMLSDWKAVATELSLTHEAVYRALAQLEREGLIQRESKRVWLT
ncbi:Crp/Fnr family transcriptional regulator [Aquisalimonas sp. APHAB1-3]|uniref:Crp/Fnr family transcriptional regulator n=1 Tax=Aquisalimonas sp. APHAB1-3 TaxID=3402080 RepID=UPI003AAA7C04